MGKSLLLLQALELIRKKPGITVAELASGLGRSERTVYRYLSDLSSELNVPICCQDGTYSLVTSSGIDILAAIPPADTSAEDTAVKVRLSPRIASMVKQGRFAHPHSLQELETGESILTVTTDRHRELMGWILSHGDEAEALEPQELRRRLRCTARRALRLYDSEAISLDDRHVGESCERPC